LASVDVDIDLYDDEFPETLKFMLEESIIVAVDGQEQAESYEHLRRGKCMTCGSTMKENAQMLVVAEGIAGIWCCGECLGDIVNITFLEKRKQQGCRGD
jgi:hypothetical protein